MSGVLIIRREPSRMRRFRDFARNDLLESVDTLAGAVDGVHEMHFCGLWIVSAGMGSV